MSYTGCDLGGVNSLERIKLRCSCEGSCWIWTLSKKHGSKGVSTPTGSIVLPGQPPRVMNIRRGALLLQGKHFPKGHVAYPRTTCKAPLDCCNPDHMRIGTRRASIAFYKQLGIYKSPEKTAHMRSLSQRKLTMTQASEIRASSLSAKELGLMYGVTSQTILNIRNGVHYKKPANSVWEFGGLAA